MKNLVQKISMVERDWAPRTTAKILPSFLTTEEGCGNSYGHRVIRALLSPDSIQPLPSLLLLPEWFTDWLLLMCINLPRVKIPRGAGHDKVRSEAGI